MYCIKCGAENSETATYCRKCGVMIEPEVETRVAVRPVGKSSQLSDERPAGRMDSDTGSDDNESEIFAISPTLKFVKGGYVLAAVGALLVTAIASAYGIPTSLWAMLAGLPLFLIPGYFHFKQKLIRYSLTDTKLEIDEGFISRTTRSIPIRRIQDVTVSTSFAQRMLGFGDLTIDNAGDDGGKIILKNINTPKLYAEVLLRQMRRLDKVSRDDL